MIANNANLIKEAEDQILCHLINDKTFYYKYSSMLHEGLFLRIESAKIFKAVEGIIKESHVPDAINISQRIDIPDSFTYVSNLLSKINFHATFEGYLDILVNDYKSRALEKIIANAKGQLDKKSSSDDVISFINGELVSIVNKNYKPVKSMSSHLKAMFDNIELNRNSDGLTGLGTGLTLYDKFAGGNHLSDLVIIAGNSSMGKTSMMLTMAANTAIMFNNPIGIWSLEMSTLQLVSRLASQQSNINSKDILRGKLSDEQIATINTGITPLSKAPIYIEDYISNDLYTICNSIRAFYIQYGIKQAFVDYIQLISNGKKNSNREEQLGDIARAFKNLAKELNINITALSQMNRENSKRAIKEPILSDLRGSGQLEEAADVVLFPYRPEYYGITEFSDGSSTFGKADLIIAKGRNIGIGNLRVRFDEKLTRFSDENSNNYDIVESEKPSTTMQPNVEFINTVTNNSEDIPF